MDFLELARSRYSVRRFSPTEVEQDKLDVILEAGRVAPTAANYQPQRILIIRGEEGQARVKECTRYHFRAPLTLLVCYDNITSWKDHRDRDMGVVDASIVTANMMYAAWQLGLGSTWVAAFSHEKARELFEIPDHLTPVALLPLGYPAEEAKPSPLHEQRFPLEHTVFEGTFAGVQPGEEHERYEY